MPFVDSLEQQHRLLSIIPYQIIVYIDHIVTRASHISRILESSIKDKLVGHSFLYVFNLLIIYFQYNKERQMLHGGKCSIDDWVGYLYFVMFSYNNSVHSSKNILPSLPIRNVIPIEWCLLKKSQTIPLWRTLLPQDIHINLSHHVHGAQAMQKKLIDLYHLDCITRTYDSSWGLHISLTS